MTKKPLKFHQTLNLQPRSANHGKHRRTGPSVHSDPAQRADNSAGRAIATLAADALAYALFKSRNSVIPGGLTYVTAPEPPPIPHAGIRTSEVIGYRMWYVYGGKLRSLAHIKFWEPNETIYGNVDKFVAYNIKGGTYAFNSASTLHLEILLALESTFCPEIAWGTIKMWGEVVEHDEGYRAEYAKLHTIDGVRAMGTTLNAMRLLYNV